RYPDGVWLVALDALADPDRVPRSVATAIGAREQPATSLTDVLVDVLRPKQALLILDNCEHLIEACAMVAHRLLSACPDLRVLATSRERLGVTGETVWQVPPMPIPQSKKLPVASLRRHEAIELFVDRATSAAPRFELNEDNAPAVAQICRRLDGIPLALELAAARVVSLEPNDIARRLDDHLDVLGEGSRTAPPRQRTLAAAIDWSHQLLEDAERLLFNRLSVFAGGFTLEAAEDVCCHPTIPADQVVGLLSRLVERSLVLPPHHARGPTRYRLLETLRHFGRERLNETGETEGLRKRHVRYYLSLAEEAQSELRGPNQAELLDRLEAEHFNLRAALEYSRADAEVGLRLAGALWHFWEARGHVGEGLEWLERLLTGDSPVEDRVRARATLVAAWLALANAETDRAANLCSEAMRLYGSLGDRSGIALSTHLMGWLAQYRGAYGEASKWLEEALAEHERLDESWQMAFALHHLGMVSRLRGDYEQANRQHERSLDLYQRAGDRLRQAYALWMLGTVARYQGDYATSSIRLEESLRLLGELGDRSGVAHVQYTLGDVARLREDHAEAVSLYEESLARLRELGDKRCVASTLGNLAAVAQLHSDPDRTEALFLESLGLRRELDDKAGIAECLEGLASVNISRDEPAHAAQMLGAAQALRDITGSVRPEVERAAHDRQVAALREALRNEIFETSWTMGSQDPERIIVLVTTQQRATR
ncbi:MAG: tetratricopeptide repeat protein, partial [Actinobacteria bacterium]|nr:tetratricopeptide repeat protein [Actinomycetota bacterium]